MLRHASVVALAPAGLLACATTAAPGPATAPSLVELRNATYFGIAAQPGAVTLHDGRWEGEPAAPGAASRPVAELAGDLRVTGDLDGDGQPEAVAVLNYSAGGSGVLSYLVVVRRAAGALRNIATTLLGDRVQIRSMRIDARKISMSAVRAGAGDPACCGGELVEWQWALVKGRLAAIIATTTGRLSLNTLSGTQWVLQAWNIGEPAEPTPTVTLAYDAHRFTGMSGCNSYSIGVNSQPAPGEIGLGPIAGTRMACPEDASADEARFLEQLGGARRFGFRLGHLAISYVRADGVPGTMLFDARSGPASSR